MTILEWEEYLSPEQWSSDPAPLEQLSFEVEYHQKAFPSLLYLHLPAAPQKGRHKVLPILLSPRNNNGSQTACMPPIKK